MRSWRSCSSHSAAPEARKTVAWGQALSASGGRARPQDHNNQRTRPGGVQRISSPFSCCKMLMLRPYGAREICHQILGLVPRSAERHPRLPFCRPSGPPDSVSSTDVPARGHGHLARDSRAGRPCSFTTGVTARVPKHTPSNNGDHSVSRVAGLGNPATTERAKLQSVLVIAPRFNLFADARAHRLRHPAPETHRPTFPCCGRADRTMRTNFAHSNTYNVQWVLSSCGLAAARNALIHNHKTVYKQTVFLARRLLFRKRYP